MKSFLIFCCLILLGCLPNLATGENCKFAEGYWLPEKYIDAMLKSKSNLHNPEYLKPVESIFVENNAVYVKTYGGEFTPVIFKSSEIRRECEIEYLSFNLKYIREDEFINTKFINPTDKKLVEVECVEGRNRFVKKMFEALGYNVKKLNRTLFADLKPDIPLGKYRELSKKEVQKIIERYSN